MLQLFKIQVVMDYYPEECVMSHIMKRTRLNEAQLRDVAACCLLALECLKKHGVACNVCLYSSVKVIGNKTRQHVPIERGSGENWRHRNVFPSRVRLPGAGKNEQFSHVYGSRNH